MTYEFDSFDSITLRMPMQAAYQDIIEDAEFEEIKEGEQQ